MSFSWFQGDMTGMFSDYVEVHRFTPENRDYSKPEVVATFYPHKISAVHSFAITESYAVFFNPAMTYDMSMPNIYAKKFHVLELLEYIENEFTDVFIVNLKTGEVQEIQVKISFVYIFHWKKPSKMLLSSVYKYVSSVLTGCFSL